MNAIRDSSRLIYEKFEKKDGNFNIKSLIFALQFKPLKRLDMDVIKFVQDAYVKEPRKIDFRPGDNVNVSYRIIEGSKERIQIFRGDIIQIKGEGSNKTFTVRKISNGVGVERIFPVNSPSIADIKILKRGKVRRAKLYYLRDLVGKKARIKERKFIK